MKPAFAVRELGQSIWMDNIRRDQLVNGEFKRLIDEEGISGVTSNPTIFEKAIAAGTHYDPGLRALVGEGTDPGEIFEALAIDDLRNAADMLRPIYDSTEGRDGFVSIEVSPGLAHDTEGTIAEARRLWSRLDRPNIMVKIPGTKAGLPAIEQCLADGLNINITLLFSIERYLEVMERYLRALERRADAGLPLHRTASVASFFVSRVDTAVDKIIDAKVAASATDAERARWLKLRGTIAIANAKVAYQRFREVFSTERWTRLEAAGARVQKPLWASTGTKDPAYSDVLYVEELIGAHTVDTLPPASLEAFNDHGVVAPTLEADVDAAVAALHELAELGVDLKQVTDQLEREGVDSFAKSFDSLLEGISGKRDLILAERGTAQSASLGALKVPVAEAMTELEGMRFARRLWDRDRTLWSSDPAVQKLAAERMGWLDSATAMRAEIPRLQAFAAKLRDEGFTHAVVLGMGGSSLAPEVLRESLGVAPGFLDLLVLDSTDPDQIAALEAQLDLEHTLFIPSSKSGTTTEALSFLEYFWAKRPHGANFAVITDPDTSLQRLAETRGFREIFLNIEDIGGRYSAISFVGMVPAALLGIDLNLLLDRVDAMARACGPDVPLESNPGLALGAVLGRGAREGRDKMTLVTSPGIASFGYWVEQLIAESTGKQGRGILPVEGEPVGLPSVYGNDRVFVYMRLPDGTNDAAVHELEVAGQPVVRVPVADAYALGGEFLRWEIAVVTASVLIGVEPFDQPNVEESKDNTRRILREYESRGALPRERPLLEDGLTIYGSGPAAAAMRKAADPPDAFERFLETVTPGDYIAITAYLPRAAETEAALSRLRVALRDHLKVATTLGYGPRFLHSTGQLHKGGAANGVFLQLTHEPARELPVPGAPFTFGLLEAAQALGDLQALQARGRRAVSVDLGTDVHRGLKRLADALRLA